MDLQDRLNWQQACSILGCKKTTLYKLVSEGHIHAHGVGTRYRWYSRNACLSYLNKHSVKTTCQEQQ